MSDRRPIPRGSAVGSSPPGPSTRVLLITAVVAVLLVIVATVVAYLILRQPPLEPLVVPSSATA